MSSAKLTKCPYTLKPLNELAETSREHIILDALGGPDGYWVTASRTANNDFGRTVDAAFLAEPLVAMLTSKVGVKTRSGVASWNLKGETVEGNRPVEVTFTHEGPVEVYHRKPVEKDSQGNSFQIIAPQEQAGQILQELKANLAKKGKEIAKVEITRSPNQTIHAGLTLNLTRATVGLMKIAYLSCCELLGDSFFDDPLNPEWQKAIRAQSAEEADQVKLRAWCLNAATDHANDLLPSLAEHEHGIAIANLNQHGIFVAVRLFGCELLTVVAQASETSSHGLPPNKALHLICDARGGPIRRVWVNVEGAEK